MLSRATPIRPRQGATVSGDELETSGVGSSLEATLGREIRRDARVVGDGSATMEGPDG